MRDEIAWELYCDETPEKQRVEYDRFLKPFVMCKEGFQDYWRVTDKILSTLTREFEVDIQCLHEGWINRNEGHEIYGRYDKDCPHCHGSGTITRQATWEEIEEALLLIFTGNIEFDMLNAYFYVNLSSGRLRMKKGG